MSDDERNGTETELPEQEVVTAPIHVSETSMVELRRHRHIGTLTRKRKP